jgi:hypothetical protein
MLFSGAVVFSVDFGLLADQNLEVTDEVFSYTPAFTPWFSWNSGQDTSIYASGALTLKYYGYDGDLADNSGWVDPLLRPELSYSAVNHRINAQYSIEAGRIGYTDVMGFTASGLFDGARFDAVIPLGTISAGGFYTGFLYKETAKILMTAHDTEQYIQPWNGDFDSYGASRRTFATARWDIPIGEANTLSAEAMLQFDLNNNTDDKLNSQYYEIQMAIYPFDALGITVGALLETMGYKDMDSTIALGTLVRAGLELPGSLNDRLSFTMKLSSGQGDDTLTVIRPISALPQGMVFDKTISGLASFSLDYMVRALDSLFIDGGLRYFMRTYDVPSAEGTIYGGEFWASVAWQPLDDIRLTLGGGVFLPDWGNVYPYGTKPTGKLIAGLSLSF